MKTIDDINLHHWFMDRELDFVPAHFTVSNTAIRPESRLWILEKLTGRFAMQNGAGFSSAIHPAFEDPKEAVFYELAWE
jgi:hypothetical protein